MLKLAELALAQFEHDLERLRVHVRLCQLFAARVRYFLLTVLAFDDFLERQVAATRAIGPRDAADLSDIQRWNRRVLFVLLRCQGLARREEFRAVDLERGMRTVVIRQL